MTDKLKQICDDKRRLVEESKKACSIASLDNIARNNPPPRGFIRSLEAKIRQNKTGLIAEIKKASPSAGIIRSDFSPMLLANEYERAGAACLSVLTDTPYFQGKNSDLTAARNACDLPVLRKDFILEPWQIAEARAIEADCILLIMAALNDKEAQELHATATSYGMDVLIETHDEEEIQRAIRLPSGLIGINNRNLKTLVTDISTTERLSKLIPKDRIIVSESGIRTAADIARIKDVGVTCFLVGEALLKQSDIHAATKALLA